MTRTGYPWNLSSITASRLSSLLLALACLTLASCSANYKKLTFDSAERRDYLLRLDSFRERKDSYFKSDPSSPLTIQQRSAFKHLNYYPPNFSLIFRVKLIRERKPEHVGIQATGGETRPAIKYGRFEFEIDGRKLTLHVYKMIGDGGNDLFLPFTDETCGNTSYAGGRYIDLRENDTGEYTLDFNYAYNPYCAYNHDFSCPIVPAENHLDVKIDAGEMKH